MKNIIMYSVARAPALAAFIIALYDFINVQKMDFSDFIAISVLAALLASISIFLQYVFTKFSVRQG